MTAPRELRGLVPIEVLCVLAIAVIPFPDTVPIALPLVAVASLSRWARGRSWGELCRGGRERAVVGAAAGLVAIAVAAPLYARSGVSAVEWYLVPAAHGGIDQLAIVIAMTVTSAVAMELALRGWIVERVLELSPGPQVLPVLVGALAEAIVTTGFLGARLGAALFAIGLGALYVAAGRNLVAPVLARVTFGVGAVVVEAMQWAG